MEQNFGHDPNPTTQDWESNAPEPTIIPEAQVKHEEEIANLKNHMDEVVEKQFKGRNYEDLTEEEKFSAIATVNFQDNRRRFDKKILAPKDEISRIKSDVDDKLRDSKIWGFAKNVAVGAAGSLAMRTVTAGIIGAGGIAGGAVAGLGAGAAVGAYKGWNRYNKENLNYQTLEASIGAEVLIEKGRSDTPEKIEAEYGSIYEYYEQVGQALATYREIESNKLLTDNREYTSRFYTNLADLESMLQIRYIKYNMEGRAEDLTQDESAELLLEALAIRNLSNQERFHKGITEPAKQFIDERKRERRGATLRQGIKGGFMGAALGGAVGGLLEHVFDTPGHTSNTEKFTPRPHLSIANMAGGGHADPTLAQDYAINNQKFIDVVDAIRDGDTQGTIEQGWQIDLGLEKNPSLTEETVKKLHNIAQSGELSTDEFNRFTYNVLTYLNRDGIDHSALLDNAHQAIMNPDYLQTLTPEAKEAVQQSLGTANITRETFISAHDFRELPTIDSSATDYYNKLHTAGSIVKGGINHLGVATVGAITGAPTAIFTGKISESKIKTTKPFENTYVPIAEEEVVDEEENGLHDGDIVSPDVLTDLRTIEHFLSPSIEDILAQIHLSSGEIAEITIMAPNEMTPDAELQEAHREFIEQIKSGAARPVPPTGYRIRISQSDNSIFGLRLVAALEKNP